MPDAPDFVDVPATGPSYLGWRGELITEYHLARVPGLAVYRPQQSGTAEATYPFLVRAPGGVEFAADYRAFSSMRLNVPGVEDVPEWRLSVPADWVRRVRRGDRPVLLFLLDADHEHGRVVRADTLPAPRAGEDEVAVRFPGAAALTPEFLQKLVAGLPRQPAAVG